MEESFSWKIVYIAAIFSLIVLGFAYFLISPRETAYFSTEKIERIADFKNARVEGRKAGKKVWEFFAYSGWTDKQNETTYLDKVYEGKIYQDGKLSVSNLFAPRAKAYRSKEIVEAFGQPEGKSGASMLKAYLDLGKFSSYSKIKTRWAKFVADYIKFIPSEKKSEMAGKVVLSLRETSIYADRIDADQDKKIAIIPGKVVIRRGDGVLRADSAEYLGEAEQINLSGKVMIALQEKRLKTKIHCNQGSLFIDSYKDVLLSGSLEVIQRKKYSIAEEGTYSRRERRLLLKGKTKTVLEKGKAILKENSVQHLQNPNVRNILKEKTIIQANEISFSTKTGDARATGSVEVMQKGREARAAVAVYDDKNELLSLLGNVS